MKEIVVVRSAKDFEVKEKMEERKEWRAQSKSQREKWQTCWCRRDQRSASRMVQASAVKLKHTGPTEKERVAPVPQSEQLASTPEPPLPKEKGTEPPVQITKS